MRGVGQVERFRVKGGPMASTSADGMNGMFVVPCGNVRLHVIASDGSDWDDCGLPGEAFEHVSVSLPARCPTWEEMDFVKRLFWRDDETVMQLHVPRTSHINMHNHCLHMWRPIGREIPTPPTACV